MKKLKANAALFNFSILVVSEMVMKTNKWKHTYYCSYSDFTW